jgi:hypothetical protein
MVVMPAEGTMAALAILGFGRFVPHAEEATNATHLDAMLWARKEQTSRSEAQ